MNHTNTFPKATHLCGEKRIARLFVEGKAFMAYPLRVVYIFSELDEKSPVSVMVSVPKKRFKRAVKRNLLKRRMREAYRLNNQVLLDAAALYGLQLHVAFNYISNDVLEFTDIEKKMKQAIQKLVDSMVARECN